MSITNDVQLLAPSALIELFVLDSTNFPGGDILYFHGGTNALSNALVWQGVSYAPLPIESEGFDLGTAGTLPRPLMRVANVGGFLSAEVANKNDLVGCKVTRKRTFAKYLDASNFPGGVNVYADPTQFFPDENWFVERKVSENLHLIEWELSSVFDLMGVTLPFREIIQNSCPWKYRGTECGYTALTYFDKNNLPCAAASDFCSKTLTGCRVRHVGTTVPFGGFPGAVRYNASAN